MSWDRKGTLGQKYYYRSMRDGLQVTKKYYGRGAEGQAASQQDLAIRRQKVADKAYWDRVLNQVERTRVMSDRYTDLTKQMLHVTLVAHGYYCHKGHEWRRRGKMFHG